MYTQHREIEYNKAKNERMSPLTSYTKNQSRVGHRPVVEAKTLKLPEESTGKCLHSKKEKTWEAKAIKEEA